MKLFGRWVSDLKIFLQKWCWKYCPSSRTTTFEAYDWWTVVWTNSRKTSHCGERFVSINYFITISNHFNQILNISYDNAGGVAFPSNANSDLPFRTERSFKDRRWFGRFTDHRVLSHSWLRRERFSNGVGCRFGQDQIMLSEFEDLGFSVLSIRFGTCCSRQPPGDFENVEIWQLQVQI